jgi:hypothetical protein
MRMPVWAARWMIVTWARTSTARGEEFLLTTLNVRLLPVGRLAAKAYGRPASGGRGTYVSVRVPERPELRAVSAYCGPPTPV